MRTNTYIQRRDIPSIRAIIIMTHADGTMLVCDEYHQWDVEGTDWKPVDEPELPGMNHSPILAHTSTGYAY